jgi:hypothetical protein
MPRSPYRYSPLREMEGKTNVPHRAREPATAAFRGHEHACAAWVRTPCALVSISTGTPYMYCSTGVVTCICVSITPLTMTIAPIHRQSTSEVRLTHTTCILFNRFSTGMRQAAMVCMDSEIDARNITQDPVSAHCGLSSFLSRPSPERKITNSRRVANFIAMFIATASVPNIKGIQGKSRTSSTEAIQH